MNKLILASGSPRRKELLSQIGLAFTVQVSTIEENMTGDFPFLVVEQLAKEKAEDIKMQRLQAGEQSFVVLGADTVVALEDRILGKPKNKVEAMEMLEQLGGRSHAVYTGVCLCFYEKGKIDQTIVFHEKTTVCMYPMEREEIENYVDSGEPMDKAGAYAIQGRGAVFVEAIKGDYNNVVGLPVGRVYRELKKRVANIERLCREADENDSIDCDGY